MSMYSKCVAFCVQRALVCDICMCVSEREDERWVERERILAITKHKPS